MSKRKKEFEKLVDKTKTYSLKEAVAILKKAPQTKFDGSVDLAFKLNVDSKQGPQVVRGTISLPHGTGKTVRIACFCKANMEEKAKEAGTDFAGSEELIKKVRTGWCDFDVAIATPDMMKEIASLGKILGPRGLMPNPKSGTVTNDIVKAISEVKKGKVEFKMSKQADINLTIGKLSFNEAALYENASVLIKAVIQARPPAIKGHFVKSIFVSSTMGPGIRLDLNKWA